MDFGALPPEVNSAKMYAGPGSGPMLAAAAGWGALAAELHCTAASYESAIADLTSAGWRGPSSVSMASAAAPYTAWLNATAAQADQTARQASAAAHAYEAAFAATVPPPVIEANRALLMSLVATNFLGQNSAAIAAAEAHYAEMWAQDATAMYGYAGSAATATELPPFTAPPQTTNAGAAVSHAAAAVGAGQPATGGQSALTQLIAQLPNILQSLTTGFSPPSLADALPSVQSSIATFNSFMGTIDGPYTPLGLMSLVKNWWQVSASIPSLGSGLQSLGPLLTPKTISGTLAPLLGSDLLTGATTLHPAGGLSAAVGRAGMIGSLSVPANWTSAIPAVKSVLTTLPAAVPTAAPTAAMTTQSGLLGQLALAGLAGRALGSTAGQAFTGTGGRLVSSTVTNVAVANTALADDIATTATIIVIPPIAN